MADDRCGTIVERAVLDAHRVFKNVGDAAHIRIRYRGQIRDVWRWPIQVGIVLCRQVITASVTYK